jgi:hypothetical protein
MYTALLFCLKNVYSMQDIGEELGVRDTNTTTKTV